ncbi:MAG: 3-phosphoshikimate 1-carboxyvinyltransferase [bacterium]
MSTIILKQSTLKGQVHIPASKSHTIRAIALASLAKGTSIIRRPLNSFDTRAAINAYRQLGAKIVEEDTLITIEGIDGVVMPPDDIINVLNSGTTLRIALGSAALLSEGYAVFTGDEQIRSRPMGPLCRSLNDLGATVLSTRNNGRCPIIVSGRLRGGETILESVTSQYLTCLLINAPCAKADTTIHVSVLNEVPYVYITLKWLKELGIVVEHNESLSEVFIPGGQGYPHFDRSIPADFSSATFFLAAGALHNNCILVKGLDMSDPQGDKAVVDYLKDMGASIRFTSEGINVTGGELVGREIDLNATPDALPMMATLACFMKGKTLLRNVPQARLKETDRISVMTEELSKMGANIQELPDGMSIEGGQLKGTEVCGHKDHRVVMALAIAGLSSLGETVIRDTEAVGVTYPEFFKTLESLGAHITYL